MKLDAYIYDDTIQKMALWIIYFMALAISLVLFTDFSNQFSALSANYPPITNAHFLAFLKSNLFVFLVFAALFAVANFLNKVLVEVYLVILFLLELVVLLYNRPAHLKGRKK